MKEKWTKNVFQSAIIENNEIFLGHARLQYVYLVVSIIQFMYTVYQKCAMKKWQALGLQEMQLELFLTNK